MALRAVVVGGGIGGIAAAVALARAGIDVQVHEQAQQLAEVRQHRVRRVAEQRQPSAAPPGQRHAVIHPPLEPAAARSADRGDDLPDYRVPAGEVRG